MYVSINVDKGILTSSRILSVCLRSCFSLLSSVVCTSEVLFTPQSVKGRRCESGRGSIFCGVDIYCCNHFAASGLLPPPVCNMITKIYALVHWPQECCIDESGSNLHHLLEKGHISCPEDLHSLGKELLSRSVMPIKNACVDCGNLSSSLLFSGAMNLHQR